MGKLSRNKGKRGEREFAEFLRNRGFDNAKRGVQHRGGPDSPDVVGVPGVHLEVKRTESLSIYTAMEQAQRDAGELDVPVVAHRRNGKDWLVVMTADDFVNLISNVRKAK